MSLTAATFIPMNSPFSIVSITAVKVFTATSKNNLYVLTPGSGGFNVTLHANPSNGDTYQLVIAQVSPGAGSVTVRNAGGSSLLVMSSATNSKATFVYFGTTWLVL